MTQPLSFDDEDLECELDIQELPLQQLEKKIEENEGLGYTLRNKQIRMQQDMIQYREKLDIKRKIMEINEARVQEEKMIDH